MRYNAIQRCEYVNGNDIGVSLYIQGCSIHCKGCFNPETWDFNGGKEFTLDTFAELLTLLDKPYITRFSILGGEPLEKCNWEELRAILWRIRVFKPDLKIWLYTGYTYNFLMELINMKPKFDNIHLLENILKNIDVLVAGPFILEEKDRSLAFKGSRNQEIIYLK